jgi:hypothetical protein
MPTIGASNLVSPEMDDQDEWAVLDRKPASTTANVPQGTASIAERGMTVEYDALPTVSSIERPEELTKRPPYWLNVRQEGTQRVVIKGSHAPSLSLLDEYLKRWCRGNINRVDRVRSMQFRRVLRFKANRSEI